MSTRLTIVRLVAVAGLSLSLTACGKVTAQMSFKDGIGAYQQQNYRVAIAEFEEAVEHDFEYRPYAYFYLANSHDNAFKFTRKGQPENDAHLPEAEKYYKLAFEQIDPASRRARARSSRSAASSTWSACTGRRRWTRLTRPRRSASRSWRSIRRT